MWEILDEYGKSVLDTVMQHGENGVAVQWGHLFRAPTLDDCQVAIEADQNQKEASDDKAMELMELPGWKHL